MAACWMGLFTDEDGDGTGYTFERRQMKASSRHLDRILSFAAPIEFTLMLYPN